MLRDGGLYQQAVQPALEHRLESRGYRCSDLAFPRADADAAFSEA